MSHIQFLCKLATPLLENVYFAISRLIVHIAQQLRCLAPCFEGPRALKNYSWSDQMCLTHVIAQNIAAITKKSIFRHSSANIEDKCI